MLSAALLLAACGDKYDPTRVLEDLDKVEQRLSDIENGIATLESQMTGISTLLKSQFITLVSTDKNGNTIVSYRGTDGSTGTVSVATADQIVNLPIIGMAEDGGVYYWRSTADNGKTWNWIYTDAAKTTRVKVGGQMPVISVDKDGFWTINGEYLTDSKGQKVLANDISNVLFKSAVIEGGMAVFTLADGTSFSLPVYEALKIDFDCPVYNGIADASTRLKIKYSISGSEAEGAFVDVFTAYNVNATIDPSVNSISVTMDGSAEEGNIIVMAHANGNTVLKPLFFTFGAAVIDKPTHNGSSADVILEGDLSSFDIKVSANIDYTVSVEEAASKWLIFNGTKAPMTEKTYGFTADYYENASGAVRSGVISFSNSLYNISAAITVKQSPKIPEGKAGGIGSALDLMAFAAAVNAGASTERWQNDEGVVVLLNDIDMSAIENWIPIGGVDGTKTSDKDAYAVINPFKGIFDGQGFAVKGLKYKADVSDGKYGYAFFGSLDGATVKNLVLGDPNEQINWEFTGMGPKGTGVAAFAAYVLNSTVENVKNYYNIDFKGDIDSQNRAFVAGLIAAAKNSTIGGSSKAKGCENHGFARTGMITNSVNGGNGIQNGGIVSFVCAGDKNVIANCRNYGHISCPSGRTGGIVGMMANGANAKVQKCDNYGLIEDNCVGQPGLDYTSKRLGGLVGGCEDNPSVLESCTNYGNVFSYVGCRTGGFVGHCKMQIIGCKNEGIILSEISADEAHGPGWACGYCAKDTETVTFLSLCVMGGKVGNFSTYINDPESAPAATIHNAYGYNNDQYFDPSKNIVD